MCPSASSSCSCRPPELAARRKAWKAPPPHPGSDRGYASLYFDTVLQADEGVDFDFLGSAGAKR